MPQLQKFLGRFFGLAATTSAGMSIALMPVLVRSPFPHLAPRLHGDPTALLFVAMRELILLMPPITAFVTGMAWWTLRKRASSQNRWMIAASLCLLTLSAPILVGGALLLQNSSAGVIEFSGALMLFVALFSLGAAGFVAFAQRGSTFVADCNPPQHTDKSQGSGVLVPTH